MIRSRERLDGRTGPTEGTMTDASISGSLSAPTARLRIRDLTIVWLFYVACALILSYPLIKTFSTTLAGSLLDPLQHLWVMRWYRTCLLEWKSPILCPELQYPIGAPLGNFSPLHLQALL